MPASRRSAAGRTARVNCRQSSEGRSSTMLAYRRSAAGEAVKVGFDYRRSGTAIVDLTYLIKRSKDIRIQSELTTISSRFVESIVV